jgi:protease II
VFFQNKDGALQSFTFFKKQEETIDVTDSSFETNRGQAKDGFHQFVRYGVQGRTTLTAETGWLDEDMNEVLKQILLTERIWSYDGTKYTPLNIKKTSQKFKTRQNDRLINYTMTFEMSYNEINNI